MNKNFMGDEIEFWGRYLGHPKFNHQTLWAWDHVI